MYCYLLHFSQPISPRHTCQHYLGYCTDIDRRIAEHRKGVGARLTQVAAERGISFKVARVWHGGRDLERKLKNRKNAPAMCPHCNGSQAQLDLFLDFTLDDVEPLAF